MIEVHALGGVSMAEKSDYQQTLQLPKTDFPMRANLPQREPDMLARWESKQYYERLQEEGLAENRPTFILHDGPPYANGHIHIGTALNKILKDFVLRSRSMDGYRVPYVPGWDTHGLPTELKAIKDLGMDRDKISIAEFREKCASYTKDYMAIQRDEFKRLGVWGEWDNPYLTLAPEYEAKQIELFGLMAEKEYIYRDLKPVYWCSDCETALAEAEIEYHDHRSPSIYVAFAVNDGKGLLEDGKSHLVIWTTTPWTIPANLAIALHPFHTYVEIQTSKGKLVVAEELQQAFLEDVGLASDDVQVLQRFKGSELEGITCQHPLYDRESLVIVGDHVTLEAGTGCVHTAPGHGQEDYIVGLKYNLPIFAPVDQYGRFTEEAQQYAGLPLEEGNKAVTKDLDAAGALLSLSFVEHSYRHCWRCKEPVIFRATEQWFVSIDGFRKPMLDAIKEVQWIPGWGIERITNMVSERGDWCISRQRNWGVPIPIVYCEDCGEPVITKETIKGISAIFREQGSNAWYQLEAEELLPEGFVCPHCETSRSFRKETDIMDVWFDSGVSHAAVLQQRDNLAWPCDLYLEGSDQHRGWFQSSLSTSMAAYGQAPYRAVLTHGFVVDGDGRKMSKSLGNSVEPNVVMKKYGADILRLWVASAEYRGDIRISEDILKQLAEAYRRIRNTARFILGNLSDFAPDDHRVPYDDLEELDQWALHKLGQLSQRVRDAYAKYDFHVVYHSIHHFCAVDLGGFYLDVLKDRLYCDGQDDIRRRSAQTAMTAILEELVQLVAPVLAFTAEEIWSHMPGTRQQESVHMSRWQVLPPEYANPELASKWERMLAVRRAVSKALEDARNAKDIGSSNAAKLVIEADEATISVLQSFGSRLEMLFIVSGVQLVPGSDLTVKVLAAAGSKCERCWKYSESVGTHSEHPQLCERCSSVLS